MVKLSCFPSECEPKAKVIVSKDITKCEHSAVNTDCCDVRQYQIDGKVITGKEERCDWLVLNDDKKDAYYIELKGSDIKKAIAQIENTEKLLKSDLAQYTSFFRIIYKSNSHSVDDASTIKWKYKCGRDKKSNKAIAIIKQMRYEEEI